MMSKNLQCKTSAFINKSKNVHGDKYDYSRVEYLLSNTNVCIICTVHGEFYQTPSNHLSGKECIKCSYEKRGVNLTSSNQKFITKAQKKHGNKYEYSRLKYVNAKIKVCITCPKHGDFYQLPSKHLFL